MNTYKIEYHIRTLAENAVNVNGEKPGFEIEGIKLEHWDFNHRDGWKGDAWLASSEIAAKNFSEAYKLFMDKLSKIVPRIAFVGQCYTKTFGQPFLITKRNSTISFFGDYHAVKHVGLMFLESQESALNRLMTSDINDAFFYYWNDATNTMGYAPKLLVMFSAIEALAKKPNGDKDWHLIVEILGQELKDKIFKHREGLRHRLIHGEYFSVQDSDEDNYVEIIHKKIILYFNNSVLKSDLLTMDVTGPQRHPFANTEYSHRFIRSGDEETMLSLKSVLAELQKHPDIWPFKYVEPDQTSDY